MNGLNKILRFLDEINFDILAKARKTLTTRLRSNFQDMFTKIQFAINIC